jgi:hypothetical protein
MITIGASCADHLNAAIPARMELFFSFFEYSAHHLPRKEARMHRWSSPRYWRFRSQPLLKWSAVPSQTRARRCRLRPPTSHSSQLTVSGWAKVVSDDDGKFELVLPKGKTVYPQAARIGYETVQSTFIDRASLQAGWHRSYLVRR